MDDALDLYRLAEQASFSPYHFHRVYAALMGETMTETLRRMRMHRAVKLLTSNISLPQPARAQGASRRIPATIRPKRSGNAVAPPSNRAAEEYRSEYLISSYSKTYPPISI